MINVGIFDNDILIVDRSLDPKDNSYSVDRWRVGNKKADERSIKNYYLNLKIVIIQI